MFPNCKLPVIPVDKPSSLPVSSPSVQVALPQETINVGKLIAARTTNRARSGLVSTIWFHTKQQASKGLNPASDKTNNSYCVAVWSSLSPGDDNDKGQVRTRPIPNRRSARITGSVVSAVSPSSLLKNGDISSSYSTILFSDDPPSSVLEVDGERDDLVMIITSTDSCCRTDCWRCGQSWHTGGTNGPKQRLHQQCLWHRQAQLMLTTVNLWKQNATLKFMKWLLSICLMENTSQAKKCSRCLKRSLARGQKEQYSRG